MKSIIGQPINRVDGVKKVTGQAKYAAEYPTEGLLFGVVISSSVAKGRITAIDDSKALRIPGVRLVLSHKNRPHIALFNRSYKDEDAPYGNHFRPLYSDEIMHSGQPVALVVADTFEKARQASRLVRVSYATEKFETDIKIAQNDAKEPKKGRGTWERPKSRGDAAKALDQADVRIEAHYSTPVEHHNPMEMHATTVVYGKEPQFLIYDKNQGVINAHNYICNVFGLNKKDVKVLSPFVGGAFGSGLRPQYQLVLAMMAALNLKRSVRVVLTRQQMFTFGHRPATEQDVKVAANSDGSLQALVHHAITETSQFEEYVDNTVNWTGMAYNCKNVDLAHKLAHLDTHTPIDMRAPGAAVGVYALECALDEMAEKLGMDPVEFRKVNYSETDQMHLNRPHSSKELMACYEEGAEKFGWSLRNPEPRSMREGKKLVGWGMAGGVWEANRMGAKAKACFSAEGLLIVSSATSDFGTGTYTVMTQVAAEAFGLEPHKVEAKLGDSSLPEAPLSGGSWTAATIGTAVQLACEKLKKSLFKLAQKEENSDWAKWDFKDVAFREGCIVNLHNLEKKISLQELLIKNGKHSLEEIDGESTMMNMITGMPFAKHTYSAIYVEVKVDEDLGMIEVSRVVAAIGAGQIINPKTARSQILGGVVWGVSMALHEESLLDHRLGRFMNHNLSEYHIPVAKDIGDIEVIFVDEYDRIVSKMGAKGLGEIGIVGTAAAVANAIYHATGKRVRDLPITPEKLL